VLRANERRGASVARLSFLSFFLDLFFFFIFWLSFAFVSFSFIFVFFFFCFFFVFLFFFCVLFFLSLSLSVLHNAIMSFLAHCTLYYIECSVISVFGLSLVKRLEHEDRVCPY
jgi:hypothetical protein